MAWLDTNPPARAQFRRPRRDRPSGVMVIHTAENAPDFVAFDGGAEAVAGFIRGRSDAGSYHDLVDSDSGIQLVAYDCEAFHDGTGSNRHSWGGSIATRADVWPLAPKAWRDGAIDQLARAAARYASWLAANHGITVPARRITRAQSETGVPGFISHAERDPARRTDPGEGFPWQQFLDRYAHHMGATQEDDDVNETQDRRIKETLTIVRAIAGVEVDDELAEAVAPGGDARPHLKTLFIGALGHGLRNPKDPENPEPGEGDLRPVFFSLLDEWYDAKTAQLGGDAPASG